MSACWRDLLAKKKGEKGEEEKKGGGSSFGEVFEREKKGKIEKREKEVSELNHRRTAAAAASLRHRPGPSDRA